VKIYLAGPLFSQGERSWQTTLKQGIQNWAALQGAMLEVVFPFELVAPHEIESQGSEAHRLVFARCLEHLDLSDVLVANLDGPQVDDGTAWEIGYFFARNPNGKERIIGIRTDSRRSGDVGDAQVNAMIERSCGRIVHSLQELIDVLQSLSEAGA